MFNFLKQKTNKNTDNSKLYVTIAYEKYNIWLSRTDVDVVVYGFDIINNKVIAKENNVLLPYDLLQYVSVFLDEIIKISDIQKLLNSKIYITVSKKNYSYYISDINII